MRRDRVARCLYWSAASVQRRQTSPSRLNAARERRQKLRAANLKMSSLRETRQRPSQGDRNPEESAGNRQGGRWYLPSAALHCLRNVGMFSFNVCLRIDAVWFMLNATEIWEGLRGKKSLKVCKKKKKKKMPSTHFYIVWAGRMGMGDSAVTHACQSVLGQRYWCLNCSWCAGRHLAWQPPPSCMYESLWVTLDKIVS